MLAALSARLFAATALALLAVAAGAGPAYAGDVTFTPPDERDGTIVTGPWGTSYLLPTDPASRPDYRFRGSAEVASGEWPVTVEIIGARPNGDSFTLCESPQYDDNPRPGEPLNWSCTYSTGSGRHPLPSATVLEIRLMSEGEPEPLDRVFANDFAILGSPGFTTEDLSTESGTVTLSGTKVAEMGVEVYAGRHWDDGDTAGAEPLCSDRSAGSGTWSCTLDLPDDTTGTHVLSARHVPLDGGDRFTVPSGFRWTEVERLPAPTPGPTPSPPDPEPHPAPESDPAPGATTEPPPDPGATTAPDATPPPPPSAGSPVVVSPASAAPSPSLSSDPATAPADPGATSPGAPSTTPAAAAAPPSPPPEAGADTPTEYGHGLRTIADLTRVPASVVAAAAITALGFLLLVAIPAELLYSTLRANYGRVFVLPAAWAARWARWTARWRAFALPALLLTGAALGTLAEPTFPGPATALRLFLALLVSLTVMNAAAVVLGIGYAQRRLALPARPMLMPGFLLITGATVVGSRGLGMEPGVLFGLLAMAVVGVPLRHDQAGRLATVLCGGFLAIGLTAWVLYSMLGDGTGFGAELLREALTAITIGGIGSVAVAMLPLTFLSGHAVFHWSKPVWATLYAAALLAFVLVVVPLPDSWVEATRVGLVWSGVFGAFGLVSVGTWAWFRFRPEPVRTG